MESVGGRRQEGLRRVSISHFNLLRVYVPAAGFLDTSGHEPLCSFSLHKETLLLVGSVLYRVLPRFDPDMTCVGAPGGDRRRQGDSGASAFGWSGKVEKTLHSVDRTYLGTRNFQGVIRKSPIGTYKCHYRFMTASAQSFQISLNLWFASLRLQHANFS